MTSRPKAKTSQPRTKTSQPRTKTGRPKAKPSSRKSSPASETDPNQRLQKVLAMAGHGSRRACEELIVAGRVQVDGKVADELGTRVDLARQEVRVDGVALPRQRFRYYLLNKPSGVVSTNRDPAGRARVIDLVPAEQRLFTVGRLDLSSEGLILVTNDGELANQLAHPRYGVEKIYEVEVAGRIEADHLRQLRSGVYLAEAFVKVENVRVKRRRPNSTLLEMTLSDGRNREIRRMLARVGHKVLRLKRIAMGPLRLGDLPSGAFRDLTPQELEKLRGNKPVRSRKRTTKKRPAKAASSPLSTDTKDAPKKSSKKFPKRASATRTPAKRTPGKRTPAKRAPAKRTPVKKSRKAASSARTTKKSSKRPARTKPRGKR